MTTSIPLYPQMPKRQTQEEIDHRAQRIQAAIAELSQLKADIEAQGDLAPNRLLISLFFQRNWTIVLSEVREQTAIPSTQEL